MPNTLHDALLCEYLAASSGAAPFCRSHPKRRMDVDQGYWRTERVLVRLDSAGLTRLLESCANRWDRQRLLGTEQPYIMLYRRVDIDAEGRETPRAWDILNFGSAWHVVWASDTAILEAESLHPWHAFLVQTHAQLTALRQQLREVERHVNANAPLERANAALEAELKQRKLWRQYRAGELPDDVLEPLMAPLRAAYHAERDELKAKRQALVDRILTLENGTELPIPEGDRHDPYPA